MLNLFEAWEPVHSMVVWTHVVNKRLGVFSKDDTFQLGLSVKRETLRHGYLITTQIAVAIHLRRVTMQGPTCILPFLQRCLWSLDNSIPILTIKAFDGPWATNRTSRSCKVTVEQTQCDKKAKVKSAKTKSISNTKCHILIPFHTCTLSHGKTQKSVAQCRWVEVVNFIGEHPIRGSRVNIYTWQSLHDIRLLKVNKGFVWFGQPPLPDHINVHVCVLIL